MATRIKQGTPYRSPAVVKISNNYPKKTIKLSVRKNTKIKVV